MTAPDPDGDLVFEEHRSMLAGIAYRVLGSAVEAEDTVQDAWLRWSGANRGEVDDPKGYLITITTRLALDRLRRARTRRETYVGTWLPEPIATGPDLAEHAELAESVEFAMLVVLETLSPLQRVVFVLREAFGLSYGEIAGVVGREEAAVRQLAHRARADVASRRPRFGVDRAARREIAERFLAACVSGDLEKLTSLLARDVTLTSDSGGKARAPHRVLSGLVEVARFLVGISSLANRPSGPRSIDQTPLRDLLAEAVDVNAAPGILVTAGGNPILVISMVVVDGLVCEIYLLANPEKLAGMSRR